MPKVYTIRLSKTASKQLDKLPDSIAISLLNLIQELGVNPLPSGVKKLKGRDGYRVRKGDYRIIYDVLDSVLVYQQISFNY